MIAFSNGFVEYNNKKIHTFLLVEFFDDYDEERFNEDLEAFFPPHLIREQKDKCAKVINDLYYWSGDEFTHKLTPFHELGLYNFLNYMDDYRKEDVQMFNQIYYRDEDEREVREIWDEIGRAEGDSSFATIKSLRRYLHDLDNMIEDCFEDIDFITYPYLLGRATDKEDESFPYGLVDFYNELLPEDIRQEYDSLRQRIQSNLPLFEQLGEVLDIISHGVRYRGWHALFWNGDTPKSETEVHTCLDLLLDAHFGETQVDISREVDVGTGKIDFKFYLNSTERVLIEVKLGNSSKLKRGIEKQLVQYMDATKYSDAYYLIVCFNYAELDNAEEFAKEIQPIPNKRVKVLSLDVTQKKPASKL